MSKISFYNDDVSYRLRNKRKLILWLCSVIQSENHQLEELSIVLCSDNQLLKINKQHLNHDFYTDIITFDYNAESSIIGEIYISIDRVKNNAKELGLTVAEEVHRVLVHGVLHLCGYKDKSKQEIQTMRSKENHYLSLLEI